MPELINMDIMMPEMDGIEASEKPWKIYGQEDTIIAFLMARGEQFSQMAGLLRGAMITWSILSNP